MMQSRFVLRNEVKLVCSAMRVNYCAMDVGRMVVTSPTSRREGYLAYIILNARWSNPLELVHIRYQPVPGNNSPHKQVTNTRVTAKDTRAERVLEKLSTSGLTPHGRDFLVAALDPMHDTQLQHLSGWPDVETSASVNMAIKQSVTISNPGATTNWDLYIVQWPWFNSLQMVGTARDNNYLYVGNQLANSGIAIGGLCAYIVPAGADLNLELAPNYMITIPDAYARGAARAIGVGFEVINTTAEINKQGQVAVWRQPNGGDQSDLYTANYANAGGGAFSNQTVLARTVSCPPRKFSNAMLVPGTRQWMAAEGCYVVVPHQSEENPPVLVNYEQPLLFLTEAADTTMNINNPVVGLPVSSNTSHVLFPLLGNAIGVGHYFNQPTRIYPIHQAGAIFTGLSPSTTLTLTQNIYFERFPTTAEPEILILAVPSAPEDKLAMAIYSQCLLSLPVGVPASENGLGDWFAGVVKTAADWLGPAATMAGFPVIGGLASLASGAANAYLAPATPQSRPTMKPISKPQPSIPRGPPPIPPPKPRKPKKKPPPTPQRPGR